MDKDNAQPPPRGRELRKSMSLVILAWVFGSAWAAATGGAALTRFAQGLGASEFQFGLLAALPLKTFVRADASFRSLNEALKKRAEKS